VPEGLPFKRLAAFYFCFFGVVGALAPYWGPYLRSRGFGAAEIGELIALLHATKIIAPNLWGWVADRTGRRVAIIRAACLAALIGFTGVLLPGGYWWMALVMVVFSFFWHAALPQFEANTMSHLGTQTHRYPRIRLWGSVGFMLAVLALGEAVDRFGAAVVPGVVIGLFAVLAGVSLSVPAAERGCRPGGGGGFLGVLGEPRVAGLLLACFLLQASHGPFYALYSVYLQDNGYSGAVIGVLWALGVLAEIGVFVVMPRWLPRFGPRRLLTLAMALAALRWLVVGAFPGSLALQAGAQLLHAATYGVYHATAISLIDRYFVGGHQGRGQALYSSLTFGAGVAAGSLLAGHLWESAGSALTFYAAAMAAALGAGLAFLVAPRRHRPAG